VLVRTESKTAPAPTRKAARVGLFIGIGNYLHAELGAPLKPAANSAKIMHELMIKQGGLDPAKTKLVLDEQATKANLQELITRWLPSVSQPADTAFIYFSGHTGQFPGDDPTEPDGLDEAVCPYDMNLGDERATAAARDRQYRDSCILDDTLARWLQSLCGRQLVLIFDTCHSGGLAQGKGLLNPASAGRGPGASPGHSFFSNEALRVKDISQLNTILIASSASDELSWGKPDAMMFFSFCLADAMTRDDAPHPLSVQAAFDLSRKRMNALVVEVGLRQEQQPMMTDDALLPIVLLP
jgi:hypothetical protein